MIGQEGTYGHEKSVGLFQKNEKRCMWNKYVKEVLKKDYSLGENWQR